MNRSQALRRIKAYCKANGIVFDFDSSEGDGSHGTIYVGDRRTIAKHGEWSKAYLHLVLRQLGIGKDAI